MTIYKSKSTCRSLTFTPFWPGCGQARWKCTCNQINGVENTSLIGKSYFRYLKTWRNLKTLGRWLWPSKGCACLNKLIYEPHRQMSSALYSVSSTLTSSIVYGQYIPVNHEENSSVSFETEWREKMTCWLRLQKHFLRSSLVPPGSTIDICASENQLSVAQCQAWTSWYLPSNYIQCIKYLRCSMFGFPFNSFVRRNYQLFMPFFLQSRKRLYLSILTFTLPSTCQLFSWCNFLWHDEQSTGFSSYKWQECCSLMCSLMLSQVYSVVLDSGSFQWNYSLYTAASCCMHFK